MLDLCSWRASSARWKVNQLKAFFTSRIKKGVNLWRIKQVFYILIKVVLL